ncbi:hypothetical protein [Flavobacterium sp. DG2-3]|uniref:hypothetical protein n=1 Tax=Flavobacterium sp. DG2-3 TaxID=3068317 RepID=UPI00273D24A9|nr:hypothetical protein [Flavobacterium sp. DG2-3]MDP5200305.1 hypothetical protein [Flavobacterium sp. DG2-3]
MTTSYFLTGSFNDQDNDFEIAITIPDQHSQASSEMYTLVLKDISGERRTLWQTSQPDLMECLDALDVFLSENFIVLYSKILTSAQRDAAADKELEGFILNRLGWLE